MSYKTLLNDDLIFAPDAEFEDAHFERVDFSPHPLTSVSFLNCRFEHCNLANQSLVNSSWRDIQFESCNLIGIDWTEARRLENIQFVGSKLDHSVFRGRKMPKFKWLECSLVDVDFTRAEIPLSDFSKSNLAGAILDGANLEGADLRTSRDYLFDVRKCRINGAKLRMPYASALLTALGAEIDY